MTSFLRTGILLAMLMIASSVLAIYSRPSKLMSEQNTMPNLEELIPKSFGEWHSDEAGTSFIVNPAVQENLWGIYSQSLSRTYRHNSGYRIMLSLAYGGDQSRALQVHRPEVCYAAGGFQIDRMEKASTEITIGNIPVMHLVATQQNRQEPITYWVRIGDKLVRGNLEQGFARLDYGLRGYKPDGLLFRVSSIDLNTDKAFAMQSTFIRELSTVIPANQRRSLFGAIGQQTDNP